jgi:hypothetical protein
MDWGGCDYLATDNMINGFGNDNWQDDHGEQVPAFIKETEFIYG